MANRVELITIPYEVYKSDINVLLNRLDRLEQKFDQQRQQPDKKLKIGEVWQLLKQHGVEYANAQNCKSWLKKNNIKMVQGETSCAYYMKSEILNHL